MPANEKQTREIAAWTRGTGPEGPSLRAYHAFPRAMRKMNRPRMTSGVFTCVLVLSSLGLAPVWAQTALGGENHPLWIDSDVVAVLPFANISGRPQDDWRGAGIADTVRADLETRNSAPVIGPEVLLAEARREGTDLAVEQNVLTLSRRLGAAWLLTGAHQRLGDRFRITARVVNVRTGAVASAVKVDGQLEEFFRLQDRIVAELYLSAPLVPSTGVVGGGPGGTPVEAGGAAALPRQRPQGVGAEGRDSGRYPGQVAGGRTTVEGAPGAAAEAAAGAVLTGGLNGRPTVSGRRTAGPLEIDVDGPPVPVPPEVITRDASGRATVRAVRLGAPIRVDGQLDEALYKGPSMSDFIQAAPDEDAAATEKTEVWVAFDQDQIYVSIRCWESLPNRIVANEMRRDSTYLIQNDRIEFSFDTYHDRRNGVVFLINAIGGRMDAQITNESQANLDWNPIWEVSTGRFANGWTVEAAVPFKSLRYRPGRAQIWGFNVQRFNRWKNERSYLVRLPRALGPAAIMQMSLAATLVGLEAPAVSANLAIKPYAISDLTSDLTASPTISNDLGGDVGVDVKYGLTPNLTADFTYNTDFAQVEADEQQVNLTRFSLFFPEKREFFLENQGTFAFGGAKTSRSAGAGDTPILFYSRRIGLHEGRAAPIQAGGRLTGRLGRFSLGVLNIQSSDEPRSGARETNFAVVRLRRDLLRRSSIGALFTRRSVGQDGVGTNDAYGIDGTFAFFDNLAINTYWARTRTAGLSGEDTSYRAQLDYKGDRYGVQLERLVVGDHFNPEVGFVRRDDIRKSFGQFRFSPRPRSSRWLRRLIWTGSLAYITDGKGRLETRNSEGEFALELHNSDRFHVAFGETYEFLPDPFQIASDVTLPLGGYDFATWRAGYTFGQQRPLSGNLVAEYGTFFSGHKAALTVSRSRLYLTRRFSLEPSVSMNWVDLPEGSFTTRLAGSRVTYTMTPLMFVSALLQYNSKDNTLAANVRLRWEYRPGSELFIVFNEQRDTFHRGRPDLANRAVIVKLNRLFRL